MKSRDEIISENPIEAFCRGRGMKLIPAGQEFRSLCPIHNEKTPSFTINPAKGVFHCFGCNRGGSVLDLMALIDGVSVADVLKRLSGDPGHHSMRNGHSKPATRQAESQGDGLMECTYSYRDALGGEVYQVVRFRDPKTFRQRHKNESGEWVWNMQGVERVLYNLPMILKSSSQYVWIVEGEKDADNLKKLGFVATCNVGGAGKWMDGYSEHLAGKEVIICGDNDGPGQKHVAIVLDALAKVAKTIRVVQVPHPHKDASDYIATFNGDLESAAKSFYELFESATVLTGGIAVPVQTIAELEVEYRSFTSRSDENSLTLGSWIPQLGLHVRPLVPGELVTLLAATGVGKTIALQCIATSTVLPTLLFEFELPGTLTFERFVAIASKNTSQSVYNAYRAGSAVDWRATNRLNHISVCSKSSLSPVEMSKIILQTELKTGTRPKLVLVDYHQLVNGTGKTRYERASHVAEQLKVVAKETKTVIIVSSQVGRKPDDAGPEIYLNDGKDSGSVENSSGLVLGLWRDANDKKLAHLKILKNTKGESGAEILCDFDGATLTISEHKSEPQSPISDDDVPYEYQNVPRTH